MIEPEWKYLWYFLIALGVIALIIPVVAFIVSVVS